MTVVGALVRACHPLPTAAVTAVMTAYAFALGWRGTGLLGVLVAVLVGQLSVGWSNDAHDARMDARVGRADKPTVDGAVTARLLWGLAVGALAVAVALSWAVAGWRGGSFHVLALAMAWAYNLGLSRTAWSWLPYAVAFGAMPAFLSWGLDDRPPPAWAVVVFALVGVSGHLANAAPDIEADRRAGVGGLATRLGEGASVMACWAVSGAASAILAIALWPHLPAASVAVVATWLGALVVARCVARRAASAEVPFRALLVVVLVDVLALVASGAA